MTTVNWAAPRHTGAKMVLMAGMICALMATLTALSPNITITRTRQTDKHVECRDHHRLTGLTAMTVALREAIDQVEVYQCPPDASRRNVRLALVLPDCSRKLAVVGFTSSLVSGQGEVYLATVYISEYQAIHSKLTRLGCVELKGPTRPMLRFISAPTD